MVRALCRCGCRQNFANSYLSPTPFTPSLSFFVLFLFCFFFSSYPQFSLQHKWQLFEISAGLKLALLPFSSLHFIIAWSPCEKFPGEHHVKLWDGTKLLRCADSASSNIVLYSCFIWLYQSITRSGLRQKDTIFFAFLRRPLSLWPREQALRSQMNQARAKLPVNFDLGQELVFSWCEVRVVGLPTVWLYIRELE